MRKFILETIVFAVFIYAALLVLDVSYSHFVAKSGKPDTEVWNDLLHGGIDADVVALGNSRTLHHINPFVLDTVLGVNSFNLAMDGAPINYQIRKYNVYRRYNEKPELIIQNIDFVSMHYKMGMEKDPLLPFWWNSAIRKEIMPYEPYPFPDKHIPFYRYHGYNLSSLIRQEIHESTKGFGGRDEEWDGTAYRQIDTISFIPDPKTERMFDDFLKLARSENINVVFVYTPMYIGATKKMTNLEEMHRYYETFANKYNIPVLDYTWMDICDDTAFFFNAMHLNIRGAEIFSDSLAHDIKKLNFLN